MSSTEIQHGPFAGLGFHATGSGEVRDQDGNLVTAGTVAAQEDKDN